jgi:hypothetical protein
MSDQEKHICTHVYHAELIRDFISPCPRCNRVLALAPERCIHSQLVPSGCEYCRPQRKPDKKVARLVIADELPDLRVENTKESEEDSGDEQESTGENLDDDDVNEYEVPDEELED